MNGEDALEQRRRRALHGRPIARMSLTLVIGQESYAMEFASTSPEYRDGSWTAAICTTPPRSRPGP